ncbi:hypothetical protein BS47DRAFT_1286284, partial [Hydnum rufescens UP504]
PTSPYLSNPGLWSSVHSMVSYVSPVGALDDVLLVAVPKLAWEDNQMQILDTLRSASGVMRVDVQEPRQRSKRRGGEL